MKKEKQFYQIKPEYCCIDLFRAVESGYLDEVVSGIFFPNNNDSSCKEGIPSVRYCPFCGAKIITEKTETSWKWKTERV